MSIKILSFKITADITTNDLYGPIIKVSWEESKWWGLQKEVVSREVASDLKPHKDEDGHDAWSWYFVSDGSIVPYKISKALDLHYRMVIEERAAHNRVKSLRPTAVITVREPDGIPPFPPSPSFRPGQRSVQPPARTSLRPPPSSKK